MNKCRKEQGRNNISQLVDIEEKNNKRQLIKMQKLENHHLQP